MNLLQLSLVVRAGLVFIFSQPLVGQCHLPELFGREYVRFEVDPVEAVAKNNAHPGDTAIPGEQDIHSYEAQLQEMEISAGPYAVGLSDPLLSLAHAYKARGDFDDALQSYRRALQLVRINDGLSSPRQLPILRSMLEIYRSGSDHPALGDLYQYYHRVLNRGDPPFSDERLEASLEYYAWERELYLARSDGRQRIHLLRAYQENERVLEAFTPTSQREVKVYLRLCLSQLRNLYLVLGDKLLSLEGGFVSEDMTVQMADRRLGYIQKIAYSRGRKLLLEAIEHAKSSPAVDLAALHLELGDWLQWNGGLGKANVQYARVEEVLLAADKLDLLAQWLGQPVELPDERDLWPVGQNNLRPGSVVVKAHYGVSSRGDVTALEASVADQEESWQASRIKRMLRDTHFRPRFNNGEPKAAEDVNRRYRLISTH